MVRPEGLELSTFWFVAEQGQNLSACFGVAYEHKTALPTLSLIPRYLTFLQSVVLHQKFGEKLLAYAYAHPTRYARLRLGHRVSNLSDNEQLQLCYSEFRKHCMQRHDLHEWEYQRRTCTWT